jgi:hypothetical protein
MSAFFKSAHAAIEEKDLVPLERVIGKPRFPDHEEFDKAIEYLDVDPNYMFYNPNDIISPFMYWKGPVYEPLHNTLSIEVLKMTKTKERLDHKIERMEKLIAAKDYESLFSRMDKKILIPTFVKMYKEIPDNKKYDVFTDLYVRSEYGFQTFPIDIIKDCFSKRKFSNEHLDRMKELKKDMKLNDDGTLTIYRGENIESAKSDDAFSWTLTKKTAKFFADRFNKGTGKINTKNIDPETIIDYLPNRGESEVILFPKKFGTL